MHLAGRLALGQIGRQLGDISRLIPDALHIGDHLERGGNHTQIARDRLLLEQQAHALVFNLVLHLVDLDLDRADLPGQRGRLRLGQGLGGQGDGTLAQTAHLDEGFVQPLKLPIELIAHQPNLPVM